MLPWFKVSQDNEILQLHSAFLLSLSLPSPPSPLTPHQPPTPSLSLSLSISLSLSLYLFIYPSILLAIAFSVQKALTQAPYCLNPAIQSEQLISHSATK
jgi:hypothetical protein